MLPAQPNRSLMDGLACLQTLATLDQPIGSRDVARMLGLEPTRVNRLLKTLTYLGLAEQDERRKYRPGPAIHVLAAQSLHGSHLIRSAMEPLESLHVLGFLVAMGVLWRDRVCYLYHAQPGTPPAQALGHHELFPATSSGLGMVLLASQPDAEVRSLYEGDRPRQGASSWSPTIHLDGDDGLLAQLAQVREQGYAFVPVHVTASSPASVNTPAAVPHTLGVGLGEPPYAAIGLSGVLPEDRIPDLVASLRQVADRIDPTPLEPA